MDHEKLRELLDARGVEDSAGIVEELTEIAELADIKKAVENSISSETLESKVEEAFATGFECGDEYASSRIAEGLDALTKALSERDDENTRINKGFLLLLERASERQPEAPAQEEAAEEAIFKGVQRDAGAEEGDADLIARAGKAGDETLLPAYELGLVNRESLNGILSRLGV